MTSIDELCTAARGYVDSGAVPAIQLAVAHDGKVVAFETFGAATDNTRFCVFSATKPIVASAIWMLVADGRIDVTHTVSTIVPEFADADKRDITIEQVLLHTSGFPNAPITAVEGSNPELRRARFANWRTEWQPGTRFEYHAGSAHWVLADLIERVTGTDFRDYVEQRITKPLQLPRVLGITPTDQHDLALLTAADAAAEADATLQFNQAEVRAAGVPGGGAFMTAAVMASYYQALLHNPGAMREPAVLDDARTNVRCTYADPLMGVPVNRTLGLVLAGDDGQHILRYAIFGQDNSPGSFGHAGAHAQAAWADPETGISFGVLTNAVGSDQLQAGIRSNHLATIASRLRV